jgi:hypothetical protein
LMERPYYKHIIVPPTKWANNSLLKSSPFCKGTFCFFFQNIPRFEEDQPAFTQHVTAFFISG